MTAILTAQRARKALRKAAAVALSAAAAAVLITTLSCAASADAPVQCPAGSPCVTWQDTATSGVQPDLLLKDHLGNEVWLCLNAGGCWVENDLMGVTGHDPNNRVAYLSPTADRLHGE